MILSTNLPLQKFFPHFDDKNDRTGVFRRTLFQTIDSDIKRKTARMVDKAKEDIETGSVDWRRFLQAVCCQATLTTSCAESLCRAAVDLGIALTSEVKQNATELASTASLKPLEQKRFVNAIVQVPSQVANGSAEEEDPFGFGSLE